MQIHLFQHETRTVEHQLHERTHGTLRVIGDKGVSLALHFHSAEGLDDLIAEATALRKELTPTRSLVGAA